MPQRRQRPKPSCASLREKIERITQQVSRDALERDRLSGSLRAAELSLGQARSELGRANRELCRSQCTPRGTGAGPACSSSRRWRASARRSPAQLRVAYMIGREEPLKLLLNQQDPLHSERLFAYYGYFGRARADQISDIQAHVQRLDALDAELARQQSELATLKAAQQQTVAAARARAQRPAAGAGQPDGRGAHARAAAWRGSRASRPIWRDCSSSSTARSSRSRRRTTRTAFGRSRGQLAWPVAGRVTAQFGDKRASGVQLGRAWSSPPSAMRRSARSRPGAWSTPTGCPGLGLLVIVDHGEGYLSLYGHNDRLLKAAGEPVRAGEPIAAAGDTGGRAAPELYFEIRRAGRPVDPRPGSGPAPLPLSAAPGAPRRPRGGFRLPEAPGSPADMARRHHRPASERSISDCFGE